MESTGVRTEGWRGERKRSETKRTPDVVNLS